MRILLIGDFHGRMPKIRHDFDLVLSPGDLPNNTEIVRLNFKYWKEIHTGKRFSDFVSRRDYVRMFRKAIKSSDDVLNYLCSLRKRVYLVLGNNDYGVNQVRDIKYFKPESVNKKVKECDNISLITNSQARIDGVQLLSFSGSYSNYHKTKKFFKFWNKRLTRLFKLKTKGVFTIFLTHDPPRGVLDKVRNPKSPINGRHAGDDVITKYVKKYGPDVMVCGHMHENQGKARLGKTLVINTGYAHDGRYAILEIVNNKIKSLKFY